MRPVCVGLGVPEGGTEVVKDATFILGLCDELMAADGVGEREWVDIRGALTLTNGDCVVSCALD